MQNDSPYYVLAYYQFSPIEDPHAEIKSHKDFFKSRDVKARIYINEDGINGQMSAAKQDALEYIDWMHSRPEFADMQIKIHGWHEQAFPKLTVKYRKQLAAIDKKVDFDKRGQYLSPKDWKERLETRDENLMIDVRNDYEWKVGYFEGAELPECNTFREFNQYADDLSTKVDPKKTPVMMYCTGGIRCELYSAILKEKGFDEVYQLQGGVINYGLQEGSSHWNGKLFVFDDRLAVPISDEETPVVGECHHCRKPSEDYYNCANMDCNELFLCCKECIKEFRGCCQGSCEDSPRVRPYELQNPHKPFRKRHEYENAQSSQSA